ncbi:hypothetical protein CEK28_05345 [Xenophilus sp. AP218F]|nr:hypothetical protein CEK28_05345 [Xenophilus sp. AP218F]
MFNPELSELQFLLLATALAAAIGGYLLRSWLLPRIARLRRRRLRYFQPHPYRPGGQARQPSADNPSDAA